MFKDLVKKSRSVRRYDFSQKIPESDLLDIIDTARFTPSTFNRQGMRFLIVNKEENVKQVFKTLKWASQFKDWDGPIESEQPAAYIILYRDKSLSPRVYFDDGITVQTLALAAAEKGYGTCMLQNCSFNELYDYFDIDKKEYVFSIVLALGVPVENVSIVDSVGGDTSYYRDEAGNHFVPKKSLDELLIKKQ